MSNHAVEVFTAVPKCHNCAQSVAAGFDREDLVAELASCGGGHAPGERCGALFAAQALVNESDRAALETEFAQSAGAATCREIKTVHHYPCVECVRLAAALVEKYRK